MARLAAGAVPSACGMRHERAAPARGSEPWAPFPTPATNLAATRGSRRR
jgi:hypothetical protein